MRLPRPYIPLSIRVQVAARQYEKEFGVEPGLAGFTSDKRKLRYILVALGWKAKHHQLDHEGHLVPVCKWHLDHHPALENRKRVCHQGKWYYVPDANDPDYLIYRTKEAHDIKTRIRGDGAQYSDHALARKNKRIKRNRDPKRRVVKIAQRKDFQWPKRPMRPTSRRVK